jgi:hypothetical protein
MIYAGSLLPLMHISKSKDLMGWSSQRLSSNIEKLKSGSGPDVELPSDEILNIQFFVLVSAFHHLCPEDICFL